LLLLLVLGGGEGGFGGVVVDLLDLGDFRADAVRDAGGDVAAAEFLGLLELPLELFAGHGRQAVEVAVLHVVQRCVGCRLGVAGAATAEQDDQQADAADDDEGADTAEDPRQRALLRLLTAGETASGRKAGRRALRWAVTARLALRWAVTARLARRRAEAWLLLRETAAGRLALRMLRVRPLRAGRLGHRMFPPDDQGRRWWPNPVSETVASRRAGLRTRATKWPGPSPAPATSAECLRYVSSASPACPACSARPACLACSARSAEERTSRRPSAYRAGRRTSTRRLP